ncbi:FAD-dependent oxidoreductase [Lagierella sp.]|uniref:NAD(P)/FAD-dependent oxidoreductase n=1 Tax=Lagierella sp. TaxID=2849657 RepID=UPI0026360FC9|nr:FAD-dependent oxidoreductase [Lagierella sp.]
MKTLILAGAGHGHIQILSKLQNMKLENLKVLVITNFDRQFYSGMLPGYINESFTIEDVSFKVKDYCKNENIELIFDKIIEIDSRENKVRTLKDEYHFDYLCMNLGSASIEHFGPPTKDLHYVKPIYGFKELKDIGDGIKDLMIVGGGASGIEIALAYRSKYNNLNITLVDKNKELLLKFNKRSRKIASKLLEKRKIKTVLNTKITNIKENTAHFEGGKIHFDKALVSTGVTGVNVKYSGLEVDENNFVKVDGKLFASENILAMGDMVCLKDFPHTPKAGVFAIRMTPILVNNVFSLIEGKNDYKTYIPQETYLQIINTSDNKAIMSYGPFAMHNRFALKFKNKIDTNYMKGEVLKFV